MVYYEHRDTSRDLDGLIVCNEQAVNGLHDVIHAHIHEHFELLYCTCGDYELVADKEIYRLKKGDMALIRPMAPHQTRSLYRGENRYIVLKFIPDGLYWASQPFYELKYMFPFLRASTSNVVYCDREQLKDSRLGLLIRQILSESIQKNFGYELAVRAYTEQVLLWFLRQWHARNDVLQIDQKDMEKLQEALQYIDDNIQDAMNVETLAQCCGMGKSTFSRMFSRYMGESVPSYLRRKRLAKAAVALVYTDMSITEIATEAGFATTSYFALCFREHNRLTPRQFRKLAQRTQASDRESTGPVS